MDALEFRFEIPDIFRVKRKSFFHSGEKKLAISMVDRDRWLKTLVQARADSQTVEIEILRIWNGYFRSNRLPSASEGRPFVPEKFPFEPSAAIFLSH